MQKDNVEMICSVGELVSLFEKSVNLEDFLQTVVSIIAYHMKAAVCSIYLLEDDGKTLVLRANQGLHPDSVGQVRLQVGEGITGVAVKELRAIREGRAAHNPYFKHIPNIQEERYEAFLAVPIMHALQRVGALVVQDPQPDYFNENDVKALRAIAAQLAVTIENAKLLISLHQRDRQPQDVHIQARKPAENLLLKGRRAADGAALGHAMRLDNCQFGALAQDRSIEPFTLEHFEEALHQAEKQLERLQQNMEDRLMDVASLIFNAQLLILKDQRFSGAMRQAIREGVPVVEAVTGQVNRYIDLFAGSPNARLREKVSDVKDLGARLLRNLPGEKDGESVHGQRVVVARELLPSDILKFSAQGVCGIVLEGAGGITAHISILARSLECPMIVLDNEAAGRIGDGDKLLLDANQGHVIVNPGPEAVQHYEPHLSPSLAPQEDIPPTEMLTRDAEPVHMLASINLLSDLILAKRHGAEGVGLYRSEFPFIIRSNFPTEEEQLPIYRKILEEMEGRCVVLRTLDIGGDKMLDYFPHANESNPFLGLRALRFSLRYKDVFMQQLRALLRAGADRELRIMFPLVASVDDFHEARDVVRLCQKQLADEHVPYNKKPLLGTMIELPSVIEVIEELAAEVDFMSIGSNDLIQYLLAVDRTNDWISSLYTAAHPAVFRAINRIVQAARSRDVPLSICGDMPADTRFTEFLLGIGVRSFSVDPHALPALREKVRAVDCAQATAHAQYLLALSSITKLQLVLARNDPQVAADA